MPDETELARKLEALLSDPSLPVSRQKALEDMATNPASQYQALAAARLIDDEVKRGVTDHSQSNKRRLRESKQEIRTFLEGTSLDKTRVLEAIAESEQSSYFLNGFSSAATDMLLAQYTAELATAISEQANALHTGMTRIAYTELERLESEIDWKTNRSPFRGEPVARELLIQWYAQPANQGKVTNGLYALVSKAEAAVDIQVLEQRIIEMKSAILAHQDKVGPEALERIVEDKESTLALQTYAALLAKRVAAVTASCNRKAKREAARELAVTQAELLQRSGNYEAAIRIRLRMRDYAGADDVLNEAPENEKERLSRIFLNAIRNNPECYGSALRLAESIGDEQETARLQGLLLSNTENPFEKLEIAIKHGMSTGAIFSECDTVVRHDINAWQQQLKGGSLEPWVFPRYIESLGTYFSFNSTGMARRQEVKELARQAMLQSVDRHVAKGEFGEAAYAAKLSGHPLQDQLVRLGRFMPY